jgi:hypothetical protein
MKKLEKNGRWKLSSFFFFLAVSAPNRQQMARQVGEWVEWIQLSQTGPMVSKTAFPTLFSTGSCDIADIYFALLIEGVFHRFKTPPFCSNK